MKQCPPRQQGHQTGSYDSSFISDGSFISCHLRVTSLIPVAGLREEFDDKIMLRSVAIPLSAALILSDCCSHSIFERLLSTCT